MKAILKNKKGQLGMDVAKSFMLGLMTLLIIGVIILIVVNSFNDMSLALDSFSVTNETGIYMNGTTYTVDNAGVLGFTSFSITSVIDSVTNTTLLSGNYTAGSTGTIVNATADADSTNEHYISYTYDASNEIGNVTEGSSDGLTDFFSNTSTWLSLLAIVVIILIIAVVISVVNRFGGSRTTL